MPIKRIRLAFLGIAFACTFCANPDDSLLPVYRDTPQRLYEGSVYYIEAGCLECHGVNWDGNCPEGMFLLKEKGISVSNFRIERPAEKTPLSYFKIITVGSDRMRKLGIQHDYQSYTDRARWAMANFLFSLAPESEGAAREKAVGFLSAARREVEAAYRNPRGGTLRRWDLGYLPLSRRTKIPPFNRLLQSSGHEEPAEESPVDASGMRAKGKGSPPEESAASAATGRGFLLYGDLCGDCHGLSTGLTSARTFNLRNFQKAHRQNTNLLRPDFTALSAYEIELIFSSVGGER